MILYIDDQLSKNSKDIREKFGSDFTYYDSINDDEYEGNIDSLKSGITDFNNVFCLIKNGSSLDKTIKKIPKKTFLQVILDHYLDGKFGEGINGPELQEKMHPKLKAKDCEVHYYLLTSFPDDVVNLAKNAKTYNFLTTIKGIFNSEKKNRSGNLEFPTDEITPKFARSDDLDTLRYWVSSDFKRYQINQETNREANSRESRLNEAINAIVFLYKNYKKNQTYVLPSILLIGEPGTGKTTFVDKIIFALTTNNVDVNFNRINLSGYEPGLIYSELFGHTKGAFNDAKERISVFDVRNNKLNIWFLDEIHNISFNIQSALNTFILTLEFKRYGENEVSKLKGKHLFIFGTNEDINNSRIFRDDFISRMSFHFKMKSANDSPQDVLNCIIETEKELSRDFNVPVRFSDDVFSFCLKPDKKWKGNFREIKDYLKLLFVAQHSSKNDALTLISDKKNGKISYLEIFREEHRAKPDINLESEFADLYEKPFNLIDTFISDNAPNITNKNIAGYLSKNDVVGDLSNNTRIPIFVNSFSDETFNRLLKFCENRNFNHTRGFLYRLRLDRQ